MTYIEKRFNDIETLIDGLEATRDSNDEEMFNKTLSKLRSDLCTLKMDCLLNEVVSNIYVVENRNKEMD